MERVDTIRGGKSLDAHERMGSTHRYYSSSNSERHHHYHYCQHPYRGSEKKYFPKEFKKSKPPTFDGEMKKSKDVEAWFLGMKKFFRLHDYSKNMKAKINYLQSQRKGKIWFEDVNHVRGIREEELIWDEFERLFKKKYLFETYYDERANELYELKMGSMINDENTSIFMELLRYVSDLIYNISLEC